MFVILWFLLGPGLLLVAVIASDARGGRSVRESVHHDSESGLRYVFILGVTVTFVGVMVSIAQ